MKSVICMIIFQTALFGKKFLVELEDGPKKESKLSTQKMEEMETSTLKTEGWWLQRFIFRQTLFAHSVCANFGLNAHSPNYFFISSEGALVAIPL